jgi:hypothetical protein
MKKLRLLSLTTLVLMFGVACGGSGGGNLDGDDGGGVGNPLALIAASADTTTEAGSAKTSMQMHMETPQGEIDMDADGAFDFDSKLGRMTMHMTVPGAPGPMDIEMVFQNLVIYMKYPAIAELPGSKPWIRMDLEKMGKETGMDLGALTQGANNDPSQALDYLRGVSDVEVVGEEEVRGAPATHYKGEIDFDKVVSQAPADLQERIKASIDLLKDSIGGSTIPVEVWIDEEGRVVRMVQDISFTEGAQKGSTMSMTAEFFDFGTPVKITTPPASQVMDLQELMGGMGAGTAP